MQYLSMFQRLLFLRLPVVGKPTGDSHRFSERKLADYNPWFAIMKGAWPCVHKHEKRTEISSSQQPKYLEEEEESTHLTLSKLARMFQQCALGFLTIFILLTGYWARRATHTWRMVCSEKLSTVLSGTAVERKCPSASKLLVQWTY